MSDTTKALPTRRDDIYLGLVRAIGTDVQDAVSALKFCFRRAGYVDDDFVTVDIAAGLKDLVEQFAVSSSPPFTFSEPGESQYNYYLSRMNAGDWLRGQLGDDVLARWAVARIATTRPTSNGPHVFVIKSLMHPKEVELLRAVYGKRFFVMAIYSDANARRMHLLESLRVSTQHSGPPATGPFADSADTAAREQASALDKRLNAQVDLLMRRDEGFTEPDRADAVAPEASRLAIRRTFAEADLFVGPNELQAARRQDNTSIVQRFVEKIFDEPFHTPTRDELGMAHAYVAAVRSGSLARRVGAALCSPNGDVLAVGVNDVPAPGGGHYWPTYDGGGPDNREHSYELPTIDGDRFAGVDSNDQIKLELFVDLTEKIFQSLDSDMLDPQDQLTIFSALKTNPRDVADRLFNNDRVRSAKFFDVIEFNRAVHAEMSALMSCLRNGISTVGAVLYCTTFPCHECSRHLIAAGIHRVVYVEPYSKSRVLELHGDAVIVDRFAGPPAADEPEKEDDLPRVRFEPFVGLAPRSHLLLYSATTRKLDGTMERPSNIGRKRFWELAPGSDMRTTLISRLPAVRSTERQMALLGEQKIADELEDALQRTAVSDTDLSPEPMESKPLRARRKKAEPET